jgi:hypothetical protein
MGEWEAGPELDAVIAERVMGLQPCDAWAPINFGSAGGPALAKRCQHPNCYPTQTLGSMFGTVGGAPRFSTDIAAAWQVVERLADQWAYINVDLKNRRWVCRLSDGLAHAGDHPSVQAIADTAPLAICRATLAAVDADDGRQDG